MRLSALAWRSGGDGGLGRGVAFLAGAADGRVHFGTIEQPSADPLLDRLPDKVVDDVIGDVNAGSTRSST